MWPIHVRICLLNIRPKTSYSATYSDMLTAFLPRPNLGDQDAAMAMVMSAKRQRDFDAVVPNNTTDATGLSEYQARHFAGTNRVRAATSFLSPSVGQSWAPPAFYNNTMFGAAGILDNSAIAHPQPSDLAFSTTHPASFGFMDDRSMNIPGSHDGLAQYQSDFDLGLFSPYTADMTMAMDYLNDTIPLE